MLCRALAKAWADTVRIPGVAEDGLPDARTWVAELTLLGDPEAVYGKVSRSHPSWRATGTLALLLSARDAMAGGEEPTPPVEGAGELLLLVLASPDASKNSVWTSAVRGIIQGYDLFMGHGYFLIGATHHVGQERKAHRTYQLAAREYAAGRSEGAATLAALARLATAITRPDLDTGARDPGVRTALAELTVLDASLAAGLERAWERHLAERGWSYDEKACGIRRGCQLNSRPPHSPYDLRHPLPPPPKKPDAKPSYAEPTSSAKTPWPRSGTSRVPWSSPGRLTASLPSTAGKPPQWPHSATSWCVDVPGRRPTPCWRSGGAPTLPTGRSST